MLIPLLRIFAGEHKGYLTAYLCLAIAAAGGYVGVAVLVDRAVQKMSARLALLSAFVALINELLAFAQAALDKVLLPRLRAAVARGVVAAILERSRRNYRPLVLAPALTTLSTVPLVLAEMAEQLRTIFLPMAAIVPAAIVFLWWAVPILGFAATLAAVLAFAMLIAGILGCQASFAATTAAQLAMQEHTEDVLRNLENVLALDTEPSEAARAAALTNSASAAMRHTFWALSLTKTGVAVVGGGFLLSVLWWALRAADHPLRLAVVMVALFIMQRLTLVTSYLQPLCVSLAWLRRVDVLLDVSARPAPVSQPVLTGDLAVVNVDFAYNPYAPVFTQLSWNIPAGQHIHLRGTNGSGKSTLLRLLRGHVPPDAGRILLGGRPLTDYSHADLARAILYVPQQPVLFRRTVAENITYGSDANVDVRALWQAYGLAATFLDPDAEGELSGGQRQVVYLLRLLLTATAQHVLVLLDEPAAAVDPVTAVAVWRMVADLVQGRTAVLVSHTTDAIAGFTAFDLAALTQR